MVRWTSDDDAVLRDLYAAGTSLRAIGDRLRRSARAVDDRRRRIDIPSRRQQRAWTINEDALIRAAGAAGLPDAPVARRLGRPEEHVRRRRRLIVGARSSPMPYSAVEDERLRACWAAGGDVETLARDLGRSVGSVRLRAQNLGIHVPPQRRRWQRDEDTVLREGYELGLTCAQIADRLPGRTPAAAAARAAKLGIATYARVWSDEDDERLRVLVREGIAVESIAEALARTPQALAMRARRLGLRQPPTGLTPRSRRLWTAAEDDALRINVALNPAALARTLGRTPTSVVQRMRRLGLRTGRSPHHLVARRDELTPGERLTAARELRNGGPGRVFAIASRLDALPALVRAAASKSMAPAGEMSPSNAHR